MAIINMATWGGCNVGAIDCNNITGKPRLAQGYQIPWPPSHGSSPSAPVTTSSQWKFDTYLCVIIIREGWGNGSNKREQ